MADSEPKDFVEDCLNSRLEGKFGAIKLTIDKARHEDLFIDFEGDNGIEPGTNEADGTRCISLYLGSRELACGLGMQKRFARRIRMTFCRLYVH